MSNFKKPSTVSSQMYNSNPNTESDKLNTLITSKIESKQIQSYDNTELNAVGLITPKQYRQAMKTKIMDEYNDDIDEDAI